MALDTGSTYMMIPWVVAEVLGYDPAVSGREITRATASSVEVVPLITLKVVSALGVEATDVLAACHDLPPASRVRGLLGLSFLRNFDIDLHFRRGLLEARNS
jgi:predicted aspartyl protease